MERQEVFIKSIQENERLIYKVVNFYTDCKDNRDDLVQEIIYNLWKSFDKFKHNSNLSTWMYRIAMNVSIYQLKKTKRKVQTVPIDQEILNSPETVLNDSEEKLQTLKKHIGDLNLIEKGILMLYLERKSYEEIAEIVGISKTNVGTKLTRIKDKLRLVNSK